MEFWFRSRDETATTNDGCVNEAVFQETMNDIRLVT